MKLPTAIPTLILVCAGLGCATGAAGRSASGDPGEAPAGKAGDKEDGSESAGEKISKAEHEVEYARIELEIAKLSAAADSREADLAVLEATQKLEAARKDRDHFKNAETPTKLADKQLDVDRGEEFMEEARQELEELEGMYKQEDFAKQTKELVLQRGRKKLEFSRRGLELAKKGQEHLAGHEVPKKQLELDQAVERAEKGLAEANAKKEKAALEVKLKLLRADHHFDEAGRGLEKAKKKDATKSKDASA